MDGFTELVGQSQAVELLTQAVTKNRVAPAYLFVGPTGIGRSLAAKCFVEFLFSFKLTEMELVKSIKNRVNLGNHPDLLWVEPTYLHQGKRISTAEAVTLGVKRKAPPQIRLEQVREISQFLSRPPLLGSRSLVVIEQTETMNESAANGLLKTLEEPGRATLILITPSLDSLLPTIVSRCQRIPFYRLKTEDMNQVLQQTGNQEILTHPEILAIAQGSPGAAIASWELWQKIPSELLHQARQLPQSFGGHEAKSLRLSLELAHQIEQGLELETQLWLIDYLQQCYWQQFLEKTIPVLLLEPLENAKRYLQRFAQPRLVWECTLMMMYKLMYSVN